MDRLGPRQAGRRVRPEETSGVSCGNLTCPAARARRAVAQLAELRSPKPTVGGSSPSCPAGHRIRTRIPVSDHQSPSTPEPREAALGNRQTRRMTAKQGADKPRAPERRAPQQQTRESTSPATFFSEVRSELRKVAWPTRQEVINSTIVVLIAVVVMTALIFGFDYASAKAVLFLYD